jgi:hypothetical protein
MIPAKTSAPDQLECYVGPHADTVAERDDQSGQRLDEPSRRQKASVGRLVADAAPALLSSPWATAFR